MMIEIEVTKEMLAAVQRRRYLLENASKLDEIPSDVWNRDWARCQEMLALSLAWAVEQAGVGELDLEM